METVTLGRNNPESPAHGQHWLMRLRGTLHILYLVQMGRHTTDAAKSIIPVGRRRTHGDECRDTDEIR